MKIEEFVNKHKKETLSLLKELAVIPAPSHHEEQRGLFCLNWLKANGATGTFIDEAGNVVFPWHCREGQPCVVIMAHMDVVFPDTASLSLIEDSERITAPGVGDDTANLVNMLMCIKYIIQNQATPSDKGILFVANTCEEGLGNLKGSRTIFECYGQQIKEMISFDLYMNCLINHAVGSRRYQVVVKTPGGHSHADFGAPNAISILSGIIRDLYKIQIPPEGRTTYNVGTIEGGTSVNTIAEAASMCFEFRSDYIHSLDQMDTILRQIINSYRGTDIEMDVKILGYRPCGNAKVPTNKLAALVDRNKQIIEKYTGKPVQIMSASTDANIPLSMGIPAITFGTVIGGGAHTYEEWIEKKSLSTGQCIALASVLHYCQL